MMFARLRCCMPVRVGLSVILLVALTGQVASADVLVLRSGGRIEGTLANREVISREPFAFSYISFLLMPTNRAPELLTFAVAEVEYVLLESQDGSRVIDFQAFPAAPLQKQQALNGQNPNPRGWNASPMNAEELRRRDRNRGIALMTLGGLVGTLAVLVPFESNYRTYGYARVDTGNTYNSANYALMGIGGFSFLAGLFLVARSVSTPDSSPSVWSFPGGAGLRQSWNF
jgi:hypothetical protein